MTKTEYLQVILEITASMNRRLYDMTVQFDDLKREVSEIKVSVAAAVQKITDLAAQIGTVADSPDAIEALALELDALGKQLDAAVNPPAPVPAPEPDPVPAPEPTPVPEPTPDPVPSEPDPVPAPDPVPVEPAPEGEIVPGADTPAPDAEPVTPTPVPSIS